MEANFSQALDRIKASEGGLRIAPSERGGASFCGITLGSWTDYCDFKHIKAPTLDEWKAIQPPAVPLTDDQIQSFYVYAVFNPIRFNELPSGVDYAIADWCVNSGNAGCLNDLRTLFRIQKPWPAAYWRMDDTLLAALRVPPQALVIDAVCNMRWATMEIKPDFVTPSVKPGKILGDGRAFRMSSVHRGAMEMIGLPPEPDKYSVPQFRGAS